jgi:hypothetical protein
MTAKKKDVQIKVELKEAKAVAEPKPVKFAEAQLMSLDQPYYMLNPWRLTPDRMRDIDFQEYAKIIKKCRFYYRKDAMASTTINKMIDIGITEILFSKNKLSDNEFRIFEALKPSLFRYARELALEYLISGLVVPEISYGVKNKDEMRLMRMEVKKAESLILPTSMWIRDPLTIEIKQVLQDRPTYFAIVPQQLIDFITKDATYPNGIQDTKMLANLKVQYPEFVNSVVDGQKTFLLDNPLIFRRYVLPDSPYPIPYLNPALDILEHKRNLRKADYSLVAKILGAILQIKVGSDNYPVTDSEEDNARMATLRNTLQWRNFNTLEVDNIFQLFTDHTVELQWVFPNIEVLISESKYIEVNEEISLALGFPKILTTGESLKATGASTEYASISPVKTMETFRTEIIEVIKDICFQIVDQNGLTDMPDVFFKPINIHDFNTWVTAIQTLYTTGGLSRDSYADIFGYSFKDELEKREDEQKMLEDSGLPEFAPQPFSPQPNVPGQNNNKAVPNDNKTVQKEGSKQIPPKTQNKPAPVKKPAGK